MWEALPDGAVAGGPRRGCGTAWTRHVGRLYRPPRPKISPRQWRGALLLLLLMPDVLPADRLLAAAGTHPVSSGPAMQPREVAGPPQICALHAMAACPCKRPTACATLYLGGMLSHQGPWSGRACPATHSMPLGLQSARRIVPLSLRSVPKMAFGRYCGPMTMWYRQSHRPGLGLCHARLVVSPSCGLGGSTLGATTVLFTNQRRNGSACSSPPARGGGLPIGVTWYGVHDAVATNQAGAVGCGAASE